MAWRAMGLTGRHAQKETTTNIVEPDKAELHNLMLAKFEDGQTYELSDLTVDDWRMRQQAKSEHPKQKAATILWQREHEASGLMMTIKPRVDRCELVSLFLGPCQECQVPLHPFQDVQARAAPHRDP